MNSTLTAQDILDAMEKVRLDEPRPIDPFHVGSFMDMKVVTAPPEPPKQKLSAGLNVSPKFRAEYDAWLLEFFGTQEPLVPKGRAFMIRGYNTLIMRPEDQGLLQNRGT